MIAAETTVRNITPSAGSAAVGRLQRILQADHEVQPVDTLEHLCASDRTASLAGARAVIGGQFDHQADLMILDPFLGTLGLVHALTPQTATADIRRLIEHAAFSRHLVLGRRKEEPEGVRPLPLTVELVLMLPPAETSLHERVGRALVEIRRTASHLHGFGISLLQFGAQPRPAREEAADLRRAFCWLLTNTRKWFAEQALAIAEDPLPRQWLRSLTQSNWRVPGERTLTFDLPLDSTALDQSGVHIVHGGNGAGKSSIVEALEFALLGRVERLSEELLAGAVEHRPMSGRAKEPASVKLTMTVDGDHALQEYVATSRGETRRVLPSRLQSGSFRLDQVAMDKLANSDDEGRAAHFLSCFFPADHETIEALNKARPDAARAWRKLPGDLASRLSGRTEEATGLPPITGLLDSLRWLDGPAFDFRSEMDGAGLCLPVPLEDLRVLARIEPALAEPVARLTAGGLSGQALEETLRALDLSLSALVERAADFAKTLDIARGVLVRQVFEEWTPVPHETTDDPVEALNRWLHALAFADLARRQRELVEALADARRSGWQWPETAKPTGLAAVLGLHEKPRSFIGQLRREEKEWSRKVTEFEQHLPTVAPAARSGTGAAMAPALTETERKALDAVTDWLLCDGTMPTPSAETAEPASPLGRTLAEALRTGKRRRCGTLTIGEPGWAGAIQRDLDTLATSLSKVRHKPDEKPVFLPFSAQRLSLLRELRSRLATLSDAQRKAEECFLNRVLPAHDGTGAEPPLLSRALDELVTLFTPARWGYATLGLGRRQGSDGQQNLSLSHAEENGAHLRLNTAELNLFTVALFLLCAPGTGNPVRLLVLDDPLQNMDEQTVTVLARGIGKLVRLLPGGWQLVFFFHGEDDLARFRNELPARIYSLPWLMPVGSGGGGDLAIKGSNPPAPCATTPIRQNPRDVLRRPR